jgi:hypothetical protein
MKGGKRQGAGRPALAEDKKKVAINVKLPPDLIAFLDNQGLSRAKTIERAVVAQHSLCPGCFRPLHKFHNCEINPFADPVKKP